MTDKKVIREVRLEVNLDILRPMTDAEIVRAIQYGLNVYGIKAQAITVIKVGAK